MQKARAYLDDQRRLVAVQQPALGAVRPDDGGLGALPIRESDRERILSEIEREVSGTRTPVTPELLAFTPRRRGSLLPIMVVVMFGEQFTAAYADSFIWIVFALVEVLYYRIRGDVADRLGSQVST